MHFFHRTSNYVQKTWKARHLTASLSVLFGGHRSKTKLHQKRSKAENLLVCRVWLGGRLGVKEGTSKKRTLATWHWTTQDWADASSSTCQRIIRGLLKFLE
ncbi:unnamed protein product [Durusdinium trenchii]|uniref:Uncharacterized protein n=1 Tax=Durusdinium trenchii TaxID=1381693 RepID=A0ABP0L1W3_9DINO